MSLQNMIAAMVKRAIESELGKAMAEFVGPDTTETDSHGRTIDDPAFGIPAKQSGRTFAAVRATVPEHPDDTAFRRENGERAYGARVRQERGRGRAKVAYVLIPRRKGERWPQLVGNPGDVLGALKAAGQPMTNAEIETALGMGNKSVQSAIHLLRTIKAIRSVPLR